VRRELGLLVIRVVRALLGASSLPRELGVSAEVLAKALAKLRLHIAFYRLRLNTPPWVREVKKALEPLVLETGVKWLELGLVVSRASEALKQHGVEHVFFKTFNYSGSVGVDADLLIKPKDYVKALKALTSYGFKLVDDPRKRYATGLALPGNPVVLDLHTDLAVLGARYLDPDILLRNRVLMLWGGLKVYVARPQADVVVRAVNAVVKEGAITLHDIYETVCAFRSRPKGLAELAERYGVGEYLKVLLDVAFTISGCTQVGSEASKLRHSRVSRAITEHVIKDFREGVLTPHIPLNLQVLALLNAATKHERPAKAILKAIKSLKYPRNTQHLARKVLLRAPAS